jgi:predicted aldo/keto reductase-like oxidoreductase
MTDRRDFLKIGALLGTASMVPGQTLSARELAQQKGAQGVQSYRRLGRTDLMISDVSFGSSRLRTGQEHLIDHALDRGINYLDTAKSYTGGRSEKTIGKALKSKRHQAYIVSKVITRSTSRADGLMGDLESSLRRLQTDYIDVYMNHAVNDIAVVANPEWQKFVDRARAQGKIRFVGISGHAGNLIDCLDYAIDNDLIDVMLTAYNFGQDPKFYEGITSWFDRIATQPDLPRAISKAKKKDIGVVAMKTLMGARLNDMRPYEHNGSTFAQAALSWVLSNQEVDALIVTMTGSEQIDEYLAASGTVNVTVDARRLLDRYAHLNGANYCKHACNQCAQVCPSGVPISDVLRTRMYATDYQDVRFARDEYALLEVNASACLSCSGQPCQDACPNGIEINKLCAPTHRMLGSGELLT